MAHHEFPISQFEEFCGKIAAEINLAACGKDDGMIPIYSLTREFLETVPPPVAPALQSIVSLLDPLLDEGKPFDESSLASLHVFSSWAEEAVYALQIASQLPVLPECLSPGVDSEPTVESLIPLSDSATASVPAVSETPEVTSKASPFAQYDILLDLHLEDNQELLGEFHTEAVDHLGQIEGAILDLEKDPQNADAINSAFRSFHTIKGVAGFLQLVPINRLAHEIESLLDLVRNGKLVLNASHISLVLEAKDTLVEFIELITRTLHEGILPDRVIAVSPLMERAVAASKGEYLPAHGGGASSTVPETVPTKPGEGLPADQEDANIEILPLPDSPSVPTPANPNLSPANAANRNPSGLNPPSRKAAENQTVRVNTSKLDNLMDMVGELVIVQSQLQEGGRQQMLADSSFQRNMGQLLRITKDLQHTSMSLRMIPIKPVFQKMERLVRDLSNANGKKVDFQCEGEDTELDRNVVEEISDPLIHMVRNAIDHGLEPSTNDRVNNGKPEAGRVCLKAYHQGSHIVIELSDDGRGIDSQKVLAKALEKGIVEPGMNYSPEEIFKFIFLPGFSTAEKITDISGRGVGMDVVRKNIEKLRGKVEITSSLGQGSTFKILLPLTMAIIDGLVVKVGQDRFILPTTSVKLALRPHADALSTVQGRGEILLIRGKIIPLFRLHNHFGIQTEVCNPVEGTVVIVETNGKPTGLLVDEMISKQEVVIKSLGGMMQGLPGIAGGAILGDGSIALILDPGSLLAA